MLKGWMHDITLWIKSGLTFAFLIWSAIVGTLGWQRVVPLVLLGFLAVQWVRENRHTETNDAPLN